MPFRTESTLGENHHKCGVTQYLGQFDVVKREAEQAVLSNGDTDAEVDEQRRQPAPGGQADGYDGDEQHCRADQQDLIQVVDSQGLDPFNFVA
jgi:hypothetical protein